MPYLSYIFRLERSLNAAMVAAAAPNQSAMSSGSAPSSCCSSSSAYSASPPPSDTEEGAWSTSQRTELAPQGAGPAPEMGADARARFSNTKRLFERLAAQQQTQQLHQKTSTTVLPSFYSPRLQRYGEISDYVCNSYRLL